MTTDWLDMQLRIKCLERTGEAIAEEIERLQGGPCLNERQGSCRGFKSKHIASEGLAILSNATYEPSAEARVKMAATIAGSRRSGKSQVSFHGSHSCVR